MDSSGKVPARGEKRLTIGIHLRVHRGRHNAVKIIIRDHLDEVHISIRELDAQRKNFMTTVWSTALRARRTDGNAADHYVVHRASLLRIQQITEFLVHVRRAALR